MMRIENKPPEVIEVSKAVQQVLCYGGIIGYKTAADGHVAILTKTERGTYGFTYITRMLMGDTKFERESAKDVVTSALNAGRHVYFFASFKELLDRFADMEVFQQRENGG